MKTRAGGGVGGGREKEREFYYATLAKFHPHKFAVMQRFSLGI